MKSFRLYPLFVLPGMMLFNLWIGVSPGSADESRFVHPAQAMTYVGSCWGQALQSRQSQIRHALIGKSGKLRNLRQDSQLGETGQQ